MSYYMNDTPDIKRGDIFYIANSKYYATDPENEAGRPAIVVSNDILNKSSSVVEVVYLTTRDKKPMPTHVGIICKIPSTALCETIYTVTKDRIGDFIKSCSAEEMAAIDKAMAVSLGLSVSTEREVDNTENSTSTVYVERNLYKTLYEQLLDRVTVR